MAAAPARVRAPVSRKPRAPRWWLTEMQRKPTTEAVPPGDEDGPALEEEGDLVEEVNEFTDDEDPPSDDEGAEGSDGGAEGEADGESQPLARPPRLAPPAELGARCVRRNSIETRRA